MKSEKQKDGKNDDVFVTRLTEAQFDLAAYIGFLVVNGEDAKDVLQETNLALWKARDSYNPAQPFLPWARTFAKYQTLAFRKRQSRDRLVFDDDLLDTVAARAEGETPYQQLQGRLDVCFAKLTESQREALREKYERRKSLEEMAEARSCSVAAVGMLLLRIRRLLAACVKEAGK